MTRLAVLLLAAGVVFPPDGGNHASAIGAGGSHAGDGPLEVTREVYLMGTRATLTTVDTDRARALERLEALLGPLEQTEARLSTWREDSEVSRLNASAGSGVFALSPSLCAAFREIDRWQAETRGAFDPAIGALAVAWDLHGRGRLADRGAIAAALRHSGWRRTGFDRAACTMTLPDGGAIDVGGFGKGEALEQARSTAGDGAGWMIDLGGQIAAGGTAPASGWTVAIAHPVHRGVPFLSCAVTSGSLSTSGGSERDLRVRGRRVGHILDPRTGRPAAFHGSVTVWHDSALVADILSTALYVMGPEEGIRWSDAHGIAAAYLVPTARGRVRARASRSWAASTPGARCSAPATISSDRVDGLHLSLMTPHVSIP